jgi:hypothetical protein
MFDSLHSRGDSSHSAHFEGVAAKSIAKPPVLLPPEPHASKTPEFSPSPLIRHGLMCIFRAQESDYGSPGTIKGFCGWKESAEGQPKRSNVFSPAAPDGRAHLAETALDFLALALAQRSPC